MDSADPAASTPTLAALTAILERHEQMLAHIRDEISSLKQAVVQLTPLPASPPAAASPPVEPAPTVSASASAPTPVLLDRFLPTPRPFSGELGKCAGFLTQCSLQFRQQPQVFSNDGTKTAYIVQLLQDHALTWAQAVLQTTPEISFANFLEIFKSVFDKECTAACSPSNRAGEAWPIIPLIFLRWLSR